MLVLSRQNNQSIVIGNNIYVTVLNITGNRIKISIDAPAEYRIRRGELPPEGYTGNPIPRNSPPSGLESNVQLNEGDKK